MTPRSRLLAVSCLAVMAIAFPTHAQPQPTSPAASPPVVAPTPPPNTAPTPGTPQAPPPPGNGAYPGYPPPGYPNPGYPVPAPPVPAPAPAPANAYPGYPPPGYAYPGYPAPANAYPGYPAPGYAYPGYPAPGYAYPPPTPQPVPQPPPQPDPGEPAKAWRLGLGLALLPSGTLSYSLNFRGEAILANHGTADSAIHISPFLERDLGRHFFAGFACQYLRPVRWKNSGTSSTYQSPFSGSGSEYDFLLSLGGQFRPQPRTRLFAFAAPGYAILDAADLVKEYASAGKPHGFLLQVGGGLLHTLINQVFLKASVSYQHGWQSTRSQSYTTGEYADVSMETAYLALSFAMGIWL